MLDETKVPSLADALNDVRERYVAANPASEKADAAAQAYMPGGNTRAVLHYDPYPLTMASGSGPVLTDIDGHDYVDYVGEFSAGLFGHSDETILAAIREALDDGIVMGSPTGYERTLAGLLCDRFPAFEQIRFCNSGTEANLMALTTARIATGHEKIIAFNDSYHGGVVKFPGGHSPLNVPFDFVLADFNDVEGTASLIEQHRSELAAVIVEPILGAGGNIPGTTEFLEMLRSATTDVGALLIFDEVKTARLGAAGMQGITGITPDLATMGKFIAGGLPTGVFGGSADLMSMYNPKQAGSFAHAGTFNNNVCSMAAGCAAMGKVFTAARGAEFYKSSEGFRASLNEMFAANSVPMFANGMGSMIAIHFSFEPTLRPSDISAGCLSLRPLLHMEMLMAGVLVCRRGDMFLSLPMDDSHLSKAREALQSFIDRHKSLIEHTVLS